MSEVRSVALGGDLFGQRIREQWTEQLGRRLDVLIAGCARHDDLPLDDLEPRITGIDEDLPAVRSVVAERADLGSWTLGDLRSVPLRPRTFDVVYVSFLLERIQYTELVLDRMLNGLRPGGLMLVRMRDRRSAYGFCERRIPSWVRALFWRWLVQPGTPGPLPAVYEPVTSRDGMHAFCLTRGLMITDYGTTTSGPARRRLGRTMVGLVGRLSHGRRPATHDEITMVIRKPHHQFARLI